MKWVFQNHLILIVIRLFMPRTFGFIFSEANSSKRITTFGFCQKYSVIKRKRTLKNLYLNKRFFYKKSKFGEMIFYGCNSGETSYDGFDTVIADDFFNKNYNLFVCPKCNCLCLTREDKKSKYCNILRDYFIRDKSIVYWHFDSSFDPLFFNSNRFA